MSATDLLPYIFTNTRLPLALQFAEWVQTSPRFRAFALTYRDKIHKKVRGITEAEGYRDLQAEFDARALYQEASTYCHSVKDYPSRELFEYLMKSEEEHIDFLETQLDLVSKLGVELYSQHFIGEAED